MLDPHTEISEENTVNMLSMPGGRVREVAPHGVEGVRGAEGGAGQHRVHRADDLTASQPLQPLQNTVLHVQGQAHSLSGT